MVDHAPPALEAWFVFFAMTGGAAATLTGLMFVVVTLLRREDFQRVTEAQDRTDGIHTFSTPTLVHFGSALLLSAVLLAPGPSLVGPAVVVAIMGIAGVARMVHVAARALRLTAYDPDVEDMIWYTVLPFLAYLLILGGAIALFFTPLALFELAAIVVLLLFIGIRNSWDVVTYIAVGGPSAGNAS